jgi:hypothetical protein
MARAHRADPVRENQGFVEGDGAVEEDFLDRRLAQYPVQAEERGNPVDLLAAARPEHLETIVERGQVVRAQQDRDAARKALVDQRATILIRAAAEVVVENDRHGTVPLTGNRRATMESSSEGAEVLRLRPATP